MGSSPQTLALLLLPRVITASFPTPPMGFNTCNVNCGNETFPNEDFIKRTIDALADRGLRDAGYVSVNLDDGWADYDRDSNDNQFAMPNKWPSGMKAAVDYAHSNGFQYGLYTALAPKTCGPLTMSMAGSCEHEDLDAQQYADWGIDFLKNDGCGGCHAKFDDPSFDSDIYSYELMTEALANHTGGPGHIFHATEGNPNVTRQSERPDLYGNSNRVGHDALPNYNSIMSEYDLEANLFHLAHNDSGFGGYFNDPDMLQVGWGDFLNDTNKIISHLTMHLMLKAPILISAVIEDLPQAIVDLLKNEEAIAINQDPFMDQARRVKTTPPSVGTIDEPATTLLLLEPCDDSNALQYWSISDDGLLSTVALDGTIWSAGESNWARPGEVLNMDQVYPDQEGCADNCGQGTGNGPWVPCCHQPDSFNLTDFTTTCLANVSEAAYCEKTVGGMVGEGQGCFLHLQCDDPTATIASIDFVDYGVAISDDAANPFSPTDSCTFTLNETCSSTLAESNNETLNIVKSMCEGRNSCDITSAMLPDHCRGTHKRIVVRGSGCEPVSPAPLSTVDRFMFEPALTWDSVDGSTGPIPHSRYVGGLSMAAPTITDVWWWGEGSDKFEGRKQLHPSKRDWYFKDGVGSPSGYVLDSDGISGGDVKHTDAGGFCLTAEMKGGNLEVWSSVLSGGRVAVAVINRSGGAEDISFTLGEVFLDNDEEKKLRMRDVWAREDVDYDGDGETVIVEGVEGLGARMFVLMLE